MAKNEEARMVGRVAEEIDDALEFNLPFIAPAELDAWRQIHGLLRLVGRFAEEASAPEPLWAEAEQTLGQLHEALRAAVARGRSRPHGADPARPAE